MIIDKVQILKCGHHRLFEQVFIDAYKWVFVDWSTTINYMNQVVRVEGVKVLLNVSKVFFGTVKGAEVIAEWFFDGVWCCCWCGQSIVITAVAAEVSYGWCCCIHEATWHDYYELENVCVVFYDQWMIMADGSTWCSCAAVHLMVYRYGRHREKEIDRSPLVSTTQESITGYVHVQCSVLHEQFAITSELLWCPTKTDCVRSWLNLV